MTKCSYSAKCNACSEWETPYSLQKDTKIANFKHLLTKKHLNFLGQIDFISAGEHSLRHKADFIYQHKNGLSEFGFYTKNRELLDIQKCLQMCPELGKAFDAFRSVDIKTNTSFIKKGSVRLRVSPNNEYGCWLDFSNIDIKNLLDDGNYFKQLLNKKFKIEVGQKKKQVVLEPDGSLKLKNLKPSVWFQTYSEQGHAIPIKCHISSFTQPSWITGQKLIECIKPWLKNNSGQTLVEFGAGVGFFTSYFLSAEKSVIALEVEESANECLNENRPDTSYESKLKVITGDFHRTEFTTDEKINIAFVNPARAGLKSFCNNLLKLKTEKIIYVSCFPESMVSDLDVLSKHYKIKQISIVDQFPQTQHYEACVLLEKLS